MPNKLSTAELETAVSELRTALAGSEWDDEVKESYVRFVEEENRLISDIKWLTDKANGIYDTAASADIEKFKNTYRECVSEFQRLRRGV